MRFVIAGLFLLLLANQFVFSEAGLIQAIKNGWRSIKPKPKINKNNENIVAADSEDIVLQPGIPGFFWTQSRKSDKPNHILISKMRLSIDLEKSSIDYGISRLGEFFLPVPDTWKILSPLVPIKDEESPVSVMAIVLDDNNAQRLVVLSPDQQIQNITLEDPNFKDKRLEPFSFGCDYAGRQNPKQNSAKADSDGSASCGGLARSRMDGKFYAFSIEKQDIIISHANIDIEDWKLLIFHKNSAWDRSRRILIVPLTNTWLQKFDYYPPGLYLRIFVANSNDKRSKAKIFQTLQHRVRPGYSSQSWINGDKKVLKSQAELIWPSARKAWEFIGFTLDGSIYAIRPNAENHWIFIGDIWIGSIKEVPDLIRGPKVVVTKCQKMPDDLEKQYQSSASVRSLALGDRLTRRRVLIKAENDKIYAVSVAGVQKKYLVIREIDIQKGPSTVCMFKEWTLSGATEPDRFFGPIF